MFPQPACSGPLGALIFKRAHLQTRSASLLIALRSLAFDGEEDADRQEVRRLFRKFNVLL